MHYKQFLILLTCLAVALHSYSQTVIADSVSNVKTGKAIASPGKNSRDTIVPHSPRKATFRSAVLPGWGQAYNKQYWKIPVVYTALGIPTGLFFYNNKWYKKTRDAYTIRFNKDSARFNEIDRKLEPISTESLRFYRNEFRRNRDYSVLFFLLAWGFNVADATVFGHLKQFDVSEDLSLRIAPTFNPNGSSGLNLVLSPKTTTSNTRFILP
jgi:hypothetical protein